jgi:hypothetical protein
VHALLLPHAARFAAGVQLQRAAQAVDEVQVAHALWLLDD